MNNVPDKIVKISRLKHGLDVPHKSAYEHHRTLRQSC